MQPFASMPDSFGMKTSRKGQGKHFTKEANTSPSQLSHIPKKKSQSTISLSPTITRNFPHQLKEKRHKSPSNCYVNSGGGELTLIDTGLTSGTKTMYEATIHMSKPENFSLLAIGIKAFQLLKFKT